MVVPPMAADSADCPSSSFQMSLEDGEQNHRKRRRNPMRVSCLNCDASKRKVGRVLRVLRVLCGRGRG